MLPFKTKYLLKLWPCPLHHSLTPQCYFMKPILSHLPNQPHSLPPKLALLLPPCKYIACTFRRNFTIHLPGFWCCRSLCCAPTFAQHAKTHGQALPTTAQGLAYLRYFLVYSPMQVMQQTEMTLLPSSASSVRPWGARGGKCYNKEQATTQIPAGASTPKSLLEDAILVHPTLRILPCHVAWFSLSPRYL